MLPLFRAVVYKLLKLTFSKKTSIVSEKVHSDVVVYHCSQVVRHTERYFRYLGPSFFVQTFQQGCSGFRAEHQYPNCHEIVL